ncbi:MAG: low specificity L-threonine aldolase [Rhodospirillales bacterium]|nr:low specificity L-threonine aldolase [Rhodospirillales bacterium]
MSLIDLRSDTVTLPTEAMRQAILDAELGDDGRERDPTARRLEKLSAEMLGKDEGLFVVSGTVSNTVAIMANVREPGTVLAHEKAHLLVAEMGAISTVGGLFYKPVPGANGAMDIDALRATIQPKLKDGQLPTVLIEVESTHNYAGGRALALDHLAAVRELADEFNLPIHMDGARIFNAAVTLGVDAREIAKYVDTVSFCLSKGLSAPIGSVIVGPAETMERAHAIRKMIGGTLRQAGIIAAPGVVALEEMVDRLGEDHANAKRLAANLNAIDPALVDPEEIESNIIMVDLSKSGRNAAWFSDALKPRGVWTLPNPTSTMRLVTHRHISETDVDKAAGIFGTLWNEQG